MATEENGRGKEGVCFFLLPFSFSLNSFLSLLSGNHFVFLSMSYSRSKTPELQNVPFFPLFLFVFQVSIFSPWDSSLFFSCFNDIVPKLPIPPFLPFIFKWNLNSHASVGCSAGQSVRPWFDYQQKARFNLTNERVLLQIVNFTTCGIFPLSRFTYLSV